MEKPKYVPIRAADTIFCDGTTILKVYLLPPNKDCQDCFYAKNCVTTHRLQIAGACRPNYANSISGYKRTDNIGVIFKRIK